MAYIRVSFSSPASRVKGFDFMVGRFSRVYTNSILISVIASVFVGVGLPWAIESAGIDPFSRYLTLSLFSVLIALFAAFFASTPLVFAKQARSGNNRTDPLDINTLAMWIAAGILLLAWLRVASQSYLGPTPEALSEQGHVDREIKAVISFFTVLVIPFGPMLSLITTFAARESDAAEKYEDVTILEKNFIEKKAVEYRSRGFKVEKNGSLKFLPNYRADLIVRKDGVAKVIEVKSRTSLTQSPTRRKLAEVLNNKPGWSYELLLVGEPEKLESFDGAQSFTEDEIRQRMDEAETVLEGGSSEAAFLLAWSACEAATRRWVEAEGIAIKRVTKARYVLDTAVFHGIISRNDSRYLIDMMKYRNAIVHGFDVKGFSDEKVTELISFVRRLLDPEPDLA